MSARSWVQAKLAALNAAAAEIAARWEARRRAEEERARPEPPRPAPARAPAVVTSRARRHRALVVGQDAYARSPLRGCRTDARRLACVHKTGAVDDSLGWPDLLALAPRRGCWETTVMLDREATQDDVFGTLRRWAEEAEPLDRVAFGFAGHGTRLPDRDDPTGEVAAIVFLDALDRPAPEWFADRCGTHREFAAVIRLLPDGALFHAWVDACHSGLDAPSLEAAARARALAGPIEPPYRAPRYLAPPCSLGHEAGGGRLRELDGSAPGLVAVDSMRSLLVAGCGPEQTSADARIGGVYCGAFTHHALAAYAEAPRAGLVSIVGAAAESLRRDRFEQRPRVHGARARVAEPAWFRPRPA